MKILTLLHNEWLHAHKILVWRAMCRSWMIGPLCFNTTVIANVYCDSIQEFITLLDVNDSALFIVKQCPWFLTIVWTQDLLVLTPPNFYILRITCALPLSYSDFYQYLIRPKNWYFHKKLNIDFLVPSQNFLYSE